MTTDYWLMAITFFLFGTAVGSFLNVWSQRLLRGLPPTGRSRCDRCGRVLSPLDLIPLLSFVLLRGRCRYCHKPLSWQYPLVEGFTGLLFAALALRFQPLISNFEILTLVLLLIASSALIAVFVTDFLAQRVFDQVLWVGFFSSVAYRLLAANTAGLLPLIYDFLGALGIYLFLQAIRFGTKRRGLGDGDPPLGFIAAILVGFPLVLVEIFLAF